MTTNTATIYNIKLSITGNSGCGKSTLLKCFANSGMRSGKIISHFDPNVQSTIGVDFFTKTIKIITTENNEVTVNLKLYDTAGQERFRSIVKCFYRDVHGIILVFDLSDLHSFSALETWVHDIYSVISSEYLVIILVGTKSDLPNILITDEMICEFCRKYKLPYVETSAKENINITVVFETLSKSIISKVDMPNYDLINKNMLSTSAQTINSNSLNNSGYCCT